MHGGKGWSVLLQARASLTLLAIRVLGVSPARGWSKECV